MPAPCVQLVRTSSTLALPSPPPAESWSRRAGQTGGQGGLGGLDRAAAGEGEGGDVGQEDGGEGGEVRHGEVCARGVSGTRPLLIRVCRVGVAAAQARKSPRRTSRCLWTTPSGLSSAREGGLIFPKYFITTAGLVFRRVSFGCASLRGRAAPTRKGRPVMKMRRPVLSTLRKYVESATGAFFMFTPRPLLGWCGSDFSPSPPKVAKTAR